MISDVLRRVEGGHAHWCPGCVEMHVIPDDWQFDGNLQKPTFNPSVMISGTFGCCHYFLHDGDLKFCTDSTHHLRGRTVPLPSLPAHAREQ